MSLRFAWFGLLTLFACGTGADSRGEGPGADTRPVADTGDSAGSDTGDSADTDTADTDTADTGAATDRDGDGVPATEDCDDRDADVHPGAVEHCDDVDEDCDGETDEDAIDAATWYPDGDRDGFGDAGAPNVACDKPRNHVADDSDCDDTDAAISPDAVEVCDPADTDEDCDGWADDLDDSVDPAGTTRWFADTDADSYGDVADAGTLACDAPSGTVADATDCDDSSALANPGVPEETCGDGLDNDCDGGAVGCGPSGTSDLSAASTQIVGESADDYSGRVVAGAGDVDGDGLDDVLIGAYGQDAGGAAAGAVYLYSGGVSGSVDASMATAKLVGEATTDLAGRSTVGAGDVDGDGLADVLVGAYQNDMGGYDAGVAYLLYGPVSGELSLSLADAILYASSNNEEAGFQVAAAGDVGGDGVADVLVGAKLSGVAGASTGTVYLVDGPVSGDFDLATARARIFGEVNDYLGRSQMAAAGDLDGDGFDDLLLGVETNETSGHYAGAAYVFHGPLSGDYDPSMATATLVAEAAEDKAGYAVAAGRDVDGDGYGDLLVGAPGNDSFEAGGGATYLFYGPVSGDLSLTAADAWLVGARGIDSGTAVALVDANGDGFADALVGAPGAGPGGSDSGAAYLVYAPMYGEVDLSAADATFNGGGADDNAGYSVANGGDLDGDGFEDLLVGAYGYDVGANEGMTFVLYGGAGL